MNRVGIVAALTSEARAFAPEPESLAADEQIMQLDDEALLTVSGMGWDAAHAGALRLARAGATALASVGTAGALDPSLECGAVLLPPQVRGLDGADLPTDVHWREALRRALPRECPVSEGPLLSTREPISSRLDKTIAWRETGCVAVDMESAAVARFAASAAVPFVVLRVIVDTAADELPGAVLAASRDGQPAIGRLLLGLAFAPWQIGPVRQLAQRFRIARERLAHLVGPGLPTRRALLSEARAREVQ